MTESMNDPMNPLLLAATLGDWWSNPESRSLIVASSVLLLGLPLASLIAHLARRIVGKKASPATGLVVSRMVRWSLWLIVVVTALDFASKSLGEGRSLMQQSWFPKTVVVLLVLIVGLPITAIAGRVIRNVCTSRFSPEIGLMMGRVVRWFLFGVVIATVLSQFGVNLGAALGAAGIVGIAVGFAAQTSLSNVISGFFLLGEKPFRVGDLIEVDGVTGTVDRIGMISASVRTPDNRSVRIPNETLVKSQVANITGNPIRRYDMEVGVAYDEDIDHVMQVLRDVADQNKHCLDEPAPLILFLGFGDSSINFLFGVWMVCGDYLLVRNSIAAEVQKAFIREGIEIPFPHRVIAGGKANVPIEVRVSKGGESS